MNSSPNSENLKEIFSSFLRSLALSENAPREQMRRHQAALTERLVRHAYETAPYYRDRLACLFRFDGKIDLSRWRDVPITTKADAIAHCEAMQATDLPEFYGPVSRMATTGSTGTPLQVSSNALNRVAANAALARTARWFGLDTSKPLASVKISYNKDAPSYPEGRESDGWCFENPDARLYELDMFTPVAQQIEWLLRKKAPYLATPPSNATDLAYAMSPDEVRALGLEAVLFRGETVMPPVRNLVAERLGAKPIALYACQEIGYIATQCPATPHYHVMAENTLVEILRDDGEPCEQGEPGRVVVTGFYNYAMPFIRYAIGDVATPGPASCVCGLTLPLIAQVDGRTRHAFVFRDGTRIWPRPYNLDFTPFVSCRGYQMAQIDHERLEFRYIPEDAARPPDRAGLETYIRDKFHPSAVVTLLPVQSLPRGPGGKFTPFVSEVAP